MTAESDTATEAAQAYEDLRVKALFDQWPRPGLDAANVVPESLVDQILSEADNAQQKYVTADGEMVFDAPAHIVTVDGW